MIGERAGPPPAWCVDDHPRALDGESASRIGTRAGGSSSHQRRALLAETAVGERVLLACVA